MISYAFPRMPNGRPYLSQAAQAAASPYLPQLVQLQKDISALIDAIPKGTVDQAKIDAIQKKLDQCRALGPTADAVTCMTDIKTQLQGISAGVSPKWPYYLGGAVVVGVIAWLAFGK